MLSGMFGLPESAKQTTIIEWAVMLVFTAAIVYLLYRWMNSGAGKG